MPEEAASLTFYLWILEHHVLQHNAKPDATLTPQDNSPSLFVSDVSI